MKLTALIHLAIIVMLHFQGVFSVQVSIIRGGYSPRPRLFLQEVSKNLSYLLEIIGCDIRLFEYVKFLPLDIFDINRFTNS